MNQKIIVDIRYDNGHTEQISLTLLEKPDHGLYTLDPAKSGDINHLLTEQITVKDQIIKQIQLNICPDYDTDPTRVIFVHEFDITGWKFA